MPAIDSTIGIECRITAIEQIHRGLTVIEDKIADVVRGIDQCRRTCRTMDSTQLRAVGRIDVLYAAVVMSMHSFAMARHEGMACHLFGDAGASI